MDACCCTPFSFITINNVTGSSTTERVLSIVCDGRGVDKLLLGLEVHFIIAVSCHKTYMSIMNVKIQLLDLDGVH